MRDLTGHRRVYFSTHNGGDGCFGGHDLMESDRLGITKSNGPLGIASGKEVVPGTADVLIVFILT